jgi:transketolase
VHIPNLETNTGSLGMGISKAKGMILARRFQGTKARAFVLTGDGELDEGQIWESLSSAVTRRMGELTVVVDHNKIQSDTGCTGERLSVISRPSSVLRLARRAMQRQRRGRLRAGADQGCAIARPPKVVIADTVKGRGVSFMEAFGPEEKFYGFHSGAPAMSSMPGARGADRHVGAPLRRAELGTPALESYQHTVPPSSPQPRHKLVEAYGRELVRQAERTPNLVALDAD